MNQPTEFDEIRPYAPEELPRIYEELIADPAFRRVVETAMPDVLFESVAAKMRTCKTNLEFQKTFFYGLLWNLVRKTARSLDFDASALTDRTRNYTFISNHRDIILDSAFLSVLLVDEGMDTVEIAIGDNLLIYPWIHKLVRINKSFIVRRGLTMRQKLEASALMSRYMHFAVACKHENLWIAQRQGRAKDCDDRTQDSVLKMMALGGEGSAVDRLKEMNLVPLSISYEYDPCDFLKAKELQQKRDNPDYRKMPADDLTSMQTGLYGYKGHVHFQAAPCLNSELDSLEERQLPKNEFFAAVSAAIDREIHRGYRLYAGNYVAYDLLTGGDRFASTYTAEEKERFEQYVSGQTAKVDLPDRDEDFLRRAMLVMYSNPLINHLKATES